MTEDTGHAAWQAARAGDGHAVRETLQQANAGELVRYRTAADLLSITTTEIERGLPSEAAPAISKTQWIADVVSDFADHHGASPRARLLYTELLNGLANTGHLRWERPRAAEPTRAEDVPDVAVRAVAEKLLRDYDSEFGADHLSWKDFTGQARDLVRAALPHVRAKVADELREDADAHRRLVKRKPSEHDEARLTRARVLDDAASRIARGGA